MSETHLTDLSGITVPTKTACALLSVTQPGLAKLEAAGYVTRVAPNRWNLVDLAQGRFRSLRDETKRDAQTPQLTRMQAAKARAIERRNLVAESSLMETETVLAIFTEVMGLFTSRLEGFPAQITRDPVLRQAMHKGLDDIRTEAADHCEARRAEHAAIAAKKG